MTPNHRRVMQSSLAYGTASLMTLTLHEFGHGMTALMFGLHPTVYGLHEEDTTISTTAVGVIAGAGPLVSLLLGMTFLAVHRRQRGQGFGRYLTLWLGLLGHATFLGYLMTAPFYRAGDVYRVLASLGLSAPLFTGLSFLGGAVGIVLLGHAALSYFLNLTDRDMPLRPQMFSLGLFAWLLGGGAVLLATIPSFPLMLIAVGTFVPLIHLFASRRGGTTRYGEPGAVPSVSFTGFGLLIVLALLEQTVLQHGVHL